MINNRRLYRFAVDLFEKVLGQVRRRKTRYQCDDNDMGAWNNFLETRDKVNEEIVRSIVEFGIQNYFSENNSQRQKDSIRFSWVFGKTAIERWSRNGMRVNNYIVRKTLKKAHRINTVKRVSNLQSILLTVRKSEERYKAEFFNTRRGLQWCIANTSLYHHKSPLCATCQFKGECKEVLKLNYNKTYKLRGYGDE